MTYVCRTNLDSHKMEKWPDDFAFPPRVGDYVESESGKVLKVYSVTHGVGKWRDGNGPMPLVTVELHR